MRFLLLTCVLLGACTDANDDSRTTLLVTSLTHADVHFLRTRPGLVASKYARMAAEVYDFYRGSLPLFLSDVRRGDSEVRRSSFFASPPLVPTIGDAHFENFGTMRASDGSFALEPNDLDSSDVWPFLWDLRRLTISLVVAAQESGLDDTHANEIVRAGVLAYADAMSRYAAGEEPRRATETNESGAVLDEAFERSHRDALARRELTNLTTLSPEGARRFIRGPVIDAPDEALLDLPAFALNSLPDLLATYRTTLVVERPASYFRVLDAVRQIGSGVASMPRVRVLITVQGDSEDAADDVVLELKELTESGATGFAPPGVVAADPSARLITMSHVLWARPDADSLWSATEWFGMPVQVRTASDAFKTLRVSRLVDDLATPEALTAIAETLGRILARCHSRPIARQGSQAEAITRGIDHARDAFADEEAAIATTYAAKVRADFVRLQEALVTRGPLLGWRTESGERAASSEAARIFSDVGGPL